MSTAKIYAKGQITIPKAIRDATGLGIGERVIVEARDGEVVIRRPMGVLEFEPPDTGRDALPWPQARQAARDERSKRRTRPRTG